VVTWRELAELTQGVGLAVFERAGLVGVRSAQRLDRICPTNDTAAASARSCTLP